MASELTTIALFIVIVGSVAVVVASTVFVLVEHGGRR